MNPNPPDPQTITSNIHQVYAYREDPEHPLELTHEAIVQAIKVLQRRTPTRNTSRNTPRRYDAAQKLKPLTGHARRKSLIR